MVEESKKWMIVVTSIWIQALTGTNLDFSSYSSDLKSVLSISQLQLNYLAIASDLGKAFGWCCGLSLTHFPLSIVFLIASSFGFIGYGLQWLLIHRLISLPYLLVFVSCLIAGCSVCWFNTVCYVLCIRHFSPPSRSLALSLSLSFNGVSGALYTLFVNAINPHDPSLFLLLNALLPLLLCIIILSTTTFSKTPQSPLSDSHSDSLIFLCFYILSLITGLYLLLLNSFSSSLGFRVFLFGAISLLFLPLFVPPFARRWVSPISPYDFDLRKDLIGGEENEEVEEDEGCFGNKVMMVLQSDRITAIEEEHKATVMVRRWDFWLYYCTYLCGTTIGLVYGNNLGQISESLGFWSETRSLVTLYSTCTFFGRLLSAAPDFFTKKIYFARTGWFALAIVPTPLAFFLLVASGSEASLRVSTGLIGLSSGFACSAAVSITSELFGPKSAGVNHNILITNIPLGSLLFGLLAALVYDSNANSSPHIIWLFEMLMCMGRKCYLQTFIFWGCMSMVGLVSSFLLFLRTRMAYRVGSIHRVSSFNPLI